MIAIKTTLQTIPKTCTKCKYSYLYDGVRFCSALFRKGGNMQIPYEYVPSVNNYCYIKPKECPLYDTEIESMNKSDTSKATYAVLKALNKQIKKKVTHEATLQKCATCPTCKNVIDEFMEFVPGQPKIRVTSSYCHFCGQALDWSEYGK